MENKKIKVVSVSLGSSTRNHETSLCLNGKNISIMRIGTDGSLEKAKEILESLDGKVDALGLGGTDIGLMVDKKWFPLHSVHKIFKNIKKSPLVDGTGLKILMERYAASLLLKHISDKRLFINKKVLIMSGCDRWGLQKSFIEEGYENIYGDILFGLGIPIILKSERQVKILASVLLPIVSRLPFKWLYPLGEEQLINKPKGEKYFLSSSIIAGDRHYIMKNMPIRLDGKIIVTNTTTTDDMNLFANAGVYGVLTTTPIIDGRSFGTNVMEASLIAAFEYKEVVDYKNSDDYLNFLNSIIESVEIKPQFTLF